MKRNVFITVCLFGVFLSSSLLCAADLQIIAIHFGNPEYSSILNSEDYEGFDFYTSDGSTYKYHEEQKLAGASRYLKGYYGEIPEKFGFSANFTEDKQRPYPYKEGLILLVGSNGVIAAKSPSTKVNPDDMDTYDGLYYALRKELKKQLKGKTMSPLKESKRQYFKTAPVGEREFYKKSKIDSKGSGLVGWPLPDLSLNDKDGNSVQLKDLTDGKVSMVVFYTMNAVHCKKGDKAGYIIEEYDPEKPMDVEAEMNKNLTQSTSAGQAFLNSVKTLSSDNAKTANKYSVLLDMTKTLVESIR